MTAMNRRQAGKVLVAAGLAAAGPAAAQAQPHAVSMTDTPDGGGRFAPATVTIAAGETVRWTNAGLLLHTVTFDPSQAADPANAALPPGVDPIDSGDIERDGEFSHAFTAKGQYRYVCKYHEAMGMVGTVIVT